MQTLTTASGKTIEVLWCGISTIDFALRFATKTKDVSGLFSLISDTDETKTLIHRFDENETVFENYTQFYGININPIDGSATVALRLSA